MVIGTRLVVVAEGGTVDDARHILKHVRPDILLIDINLLDSTSLLTEMTAWPRARTRIVGLTESDSIDGELGASRRGVRWQVSKAADKAELLQAVVAIHREGCLQAPGPRVGLQKSEVHEPAPAERNTVSTSGLTQREWLVLGYLAKGFTYMQIALELRASHLTIKTTISTIYSKLKVRNRVEAALAAQKILIDQIPQCSNGTQQLLADRVPPIH